MKKFRNLLILSMAIAGFLMVGTAAKADTLTFSLTAPFVVDVGGVTEFYGTITYSDTDSANNGGVMEYLNGDNVLVDSPSVPNYDDSAFLNNAPLSMNPEDTYTGLLFTITTPDYIVGGSNFYTGSFQIVGGNSPDDYSDVLSTADFNITVTPEPSSYLLFGTGLLALGLLVKSKLLA